MLVGTVGIFAGATPGAFSGFQSGRVREVAAVAFSRAPFTPTTTIDALPSPFAPQADRDLGAFGRPLSGDALKLRLLDRAEEALGAARKATEDMILGAYRLAAGDEAADALGDAGIDALLAPQVLEKLPPALAEALEARAAAERSAAALLSEERRAATQADAVGTAEENAALIDRAVRDHVDALLAAEGALDDAETARKIATLSLFGAQGENAARAEALMRLGRETERLTRRDGMIKEMKRGIARGEINVSVSRETYWAGTPVQVGADADIGFSVYVTEGWRLSSAATGLTAGGGHAVDIAG